MIVNENTMIAEGVGLFKNIGKVSANADEKLARNVLKSPWRALEIGAKICSAADLKNSKAASSTAPDL